MVETEIFVYTTRLPDKVHELVAPCADGYTVWLDDRLDDAHRAQSLLHAIRHIDNGDFERSDVQEIEFNAHRKD